MQHLRAASSSRWLFEKMKDREVHHDVAGVLEEEGRWHGHSAEVQVEQREHQQVHEGDGPTDVHGTMMDEGHLEQRGQIVHEGCSWWIGALEYQRQCRLR